MFTPEFWKDANKIGNALYRINQSPYKEFCEIDEFWKFLADTFPDEKESIDEIFQEYAFYVEEKTRINDVNKLMNDNPGMKKDVKYRMMEAQL